ncbi:MAG: hypothetical protein M1828_006530 [Chrysothrix sp. TS-e1954]|nr:MAG: hypothetical protein M1828_006530 [Chrysothrix sp. TS-e1954]
MATAIVLCHGSWHVPGHYADLLDTLRRDGFETHCPLLPTCNGKRPPDSSLPDDVMVIQSLIKSLVEDGRSVLVILHSYGGAVGSNAVSEELSRASRVRQGLEGGVIGLVYMCAFLLQPGETILSATHVEANGDPVIVADDATSTVNDPRGYFYDDVDAKLAQQSIAMLVPHSIQALVVEITGTPWKVIPTSYIHCSEDKVLWLARQEAMVKAVQEKGFKIHEIRLQSGHSPYLSKTQETATVLQQLCYKRLEEGKSS